MGYYKDLGTSKVAYQCHITDYPMSEDKRLLCPYNFRDGSLQPWLIPQDDQGHYKLNYDIELYNQTNPYGFLHYACGSSDDFHCFDCKTIEAGAKGKFIILDATLNSETGGFIVNAGYHVMPINTDREKIDVWCKACSMVDQAVDWCFDNDVKHSRRGWYQEPMYFAFSVAKSLFAWDFHHYAKREITDRMLRFGSKTFDQVMDNITNLK